MASNAMKCHICGCTEQRACPAGCGWAKPNLCTVCDDLGKAMEDFIANANRPTLAGVRRLFQRAAFDLLTGKLDLTIPEGDNDAV